RFTGKQFFNVGAIILQRCVELFGVRGQLAGGGVRLDSNIGQRNTVSRQAIDGIAYLGLRTTSEAVARQGRAALAVYVVCRERLDGALQGVVRVDEIVHRGSCHSVVTSDAQGGSRRIGGCLLVQREGDAFDGV